jgi:hypothetical protein
VRGSTPAKAAAARAAPRCTPQVWRDELNAGIDWLGTDHLGALRDFLE